jgi:hypothetical protein
MNIYKGAYDLARVAIDAAVTRRDSVEGGVLAELLATVG